MGSLSKTLVIAGGLTSAAAGVVIGMNFLSPTDRSPQEEATLPNAFTRINTYDELAKSYDSQIDFDELVMGMLLLRRYLLSKATGDVLEVAVGTGRNLKYYSKVCLNFFVNFL